MTRALVSIVIRTYNEERYLDELLAAISLQQCDGFDVEVVLVDSGSSDGTLAIAARHGARVEHIRKSEFTFGRSLNVGCAAARGSYLVLISGHCVPVGKTWLHELTLPLRMGQAHCTYGRQVGRDTTKFSEERLLEKYFPEYPKPDQDGFFCNNANAAITREVWQKFGYNEELTGLEDMYLGRQIRESGGKISYVSAAPVYHIHNENWRQVRVRYEREAVALQCILPNVHFTMTDFVLYFLAAAFSDLKTALALRCFLQESRAVLMFRLMQYWGTYRGSRRHRILSISVKRSYFYPKDVERQKYVKEQERGVVAHEGQQ